MGWRLCQRCGTLFEQRHTHTVAFHCERCAKKRERRSWYEMRWKALMRIITAVFSKTSAVVPVQRALYEALFPEIEPPERDLPPGASDVPSRHWSKWVTHPRMERAYDASSHERR
jgi:hypothetical protein